MPCDVALREARRLPAIVRGPVDRRAFLRFAFSRRREDVRVLMADTPFRNEDVNSENPRRHQDDDAASDEHPTQRILRSEDRKSAKNRPFSAIFTLRTPTTGHATR
jgi:hypothetical protein